MRTIPLVTSIPPVTRRSNPAGVDVGPQYLRACVDSWLAHGFEPLTVNSQREDLAAVDLAGVRPIVTADDARAITGKPLVYFQDMISAGLRCDGEVIAFTNSDILIDARFDLAALLERLQPGHAIIARRVDIDRYQAREGAVYPYGFDFFALHRDDAARLADAGLVFGAPWWDYLLPAALIAQGVRVALLTEPFAYHLLHEDRWNAGQWHLMADRFLSHVPALLGNAPDDALARALAVRIEAALREPAPPLRARLRAMFAARSTEGREAQRTAMLNRVSAALTGFCEERCSTSLAQLAAAQT